MVDPDLEPLLALYATTVFLCEESVEFQEFAIITGHNPEGSLETDAENKKLNNSLEAQITNSRYKKIIGAAPDLSHQEPSFAIAMNLESALKLARQFRQNAIFWVRNDELFLLGAGLVFEPYHLGSFAQRCRCITE